MSTRRLFIACPLPIAMQTECLQQQQQLAPQLQAARPLAAEHLHLTLRFLGNTPTECIPILQGLLADLAAQSTELTLESAGLGGFPDATSARVLVWHQHRPVALQTLYQRLQTALTPLWPPETRPFQPHVTLFRCPKQALPTDLSHPPRMAWQIQALSLYQSRLSDTGSQYTQLYTISLRH